MPISPKIPGPAACAAARRDVTMEWFRGLPERVATAWRDSQPELDADQDTDFLASLGRGHVAATLADRGFATWMAPGDSPLATVWGARTSEGILHVALVRVTVFTDGSRSPAPDGQVVDALMNLVNLAWATFRGSADVPAHVLALPRIFSAGEVEVRVGFDGAAFRPTMVRGSFFGARHSANLRPDWPDRELALEALYRLG